MLIINDQLFSLETAAALEVNKSKVILLVNHRIYQIPVLILLKYHGFAGCTECIL